MKLCACGRPLHYRDQLIEDYFEADCLIKGEHLRITVEGHTWLVPRHYIALHGPKAWEIPALAEKYGFEELS